MAALAVDQDERLVGTQPAERGRIDVVASIRPGLTVRVV